MGKTIRKITGAIRAKVAAKIAPPPPQSRAVAVDGTAPPAGQSFGMEDIVNLMSQGKDAREKAFSEMVGHLFSKDNLLMTSRMNSDVSLFIVKHLIARRYYAYYWQEHRMKGTWTLSAEPPYYRVAWDINRGRSKSMSRESYDEFISELLQVTIGKDGKGREEVLTAIRSAESKIMEEQMMQNRGGLLQRFLG